MWRLSKKKDYIFYYIGLFGIGFISSIVYYVILKGHIPGHEEAFRIAYAAYSIKPDNIFQFFLNIFVKISGYTYDTQRLCFSFWWFVISVLSLDLAMRDNDNNVRIISIPWYILFMILLHPTSKHISYFFGTGAWGDYPYYAGYFSTTHVLAVVAMLIVQTFIYRLRRIFINKKGYIRILLCGILLCCGGVISTKGDIALYFLIAVAPILVLLFKSLLLQRKNGYGVYISCIILGIALLILLGIFSKYFPAEVQSILVKFYRNAGITLGFDSIKSGLMNLVSVICGIFNADFQISDISIWDKIAYFVRIVHVIGLLAICIYWMVLVFGKKQYESDDEQLFQRISIGILAGYVIVGLTSLINYGPARYLWYSLPIGTIMICRYSSKIFVRHKKLYICLLISCVLAIVISFIDMCDFDIKMATDEKTENVVAWLDEQDLHCGIGNLRSSTKITVQSEGRHWVYPSKYEEDGLRININLGNEPIGIIDYVVLDYPWCEYDAAEVMNVYGYPDCIKCFDGYTIMVYSQGINADSFIKNEDVTSMQIYPFVKGEYSVDELNYSEGIEKKDDLMIIPPNEEQYGPYIALSKGSYWLEVQANSLEEEDLFIYYYYNGRIAIPYEIVSKNEERLIVQFNLDNYYENIEFTIFNNQSDEIELKGYQLMSRPYDITKISILE